MSFSSIYGQQRPKSILKKALVSGRLPGGYLFAGPPGVGKRTTAIAFIKALNCEHQTGDACCECSNCRALDKEQEGPDGEHPFPDFYIAYVNRSGQIVKGGGASGNDRPTSLASILPKLHFRPIMGRMKVVLLDPADGLTEEAANMLLKTLEEPPSHTLFILITTLEKGVLPTVLSRCQRVRFTPLQREEVLAFLRAQGVEEEKALLASRSCSGSIGLAREMADGPGLEGRKDAIGLWLHLLTGNLVERTAAAQPVADARSLATHPLQARNLEHVGRLVARDLLWSASGHPSNTLMLAESADLLHSVGTTLGLDGALKFGETVQELSEGNLRNENPRTLMYDIGNRLAGLLPAEACKQLKGRLDG